MRASLKMNRMHQFPSKVGAVTRLAQFGETLKKKGAQARKSLNSSFQGHVRFDGAGNGSTEQSTRDTVGSDNVSAHDGGKPHTVKDWRVQQNPRDQSPLRYGPVHPIEKDGGVEDSDARHADVEIGLDESFISRSGRTSQQTLFDESRDQQDFQQEGDLNAQDKQEQARSQRLTPDLTTLLVRQIRENTAKQIKKFTTQLSSHSLVSMLDADSKSSFSQSRTKPKRKELQMRSARASLHSTRDVGTLCSGLVSGGAGPLDARDGRMMICRISRLEDEPYKFSIRRLGKCLYFEKPPTEWDSGLLPEEGDRILEVNGIRADNMTTHDRVLHALSKDELVIRFGKSRDFPDEEAYVLLRITVPRAHGEALGASFRPDNKWLIFDRIEDGLFKRWNMQNPEQSIRPYDRLLSVNGFSGYDESNHKATMKALDGARHLHLMIGKLKANPNPYQSYVMFDLTVNKKDGQSVGLCLKHRGACLVIEEIVRKSAVQDWIDANPRTAAPDVGDVLVMINSISGDECNRERIITEMEQAKTIHFVFGKRPATPKNALVGDSVPQY
eukprot:GEMP01029102.1.p1 GENE.GEMP01029102.1~~GEMP01029102.1.p1  ORF type:complete len:556 (+),score=130.88 GEMP01029102.1:165-1832(+)